MAAIVEEAAKLAVNTAIEDVEFSAIDINAQLDLGHECERAKIKEQEASEVCEDENYEVYDLDDKDFEHKDSESGDSLRQSMSNDTIIDRAPPPSPVLLHIVHTTLICLLVTATPPEQLQRTLASSIARRTQRPRNPHIEVNYHPQSAHLQAPSPVQGVDADASSFPPRPTSSGNTLQVFSGAPSAVFVSKSTTETFCMSSSPHHLDLECDDRKGERNISQPSPAYAPPRDPHEKAQSILRQPPSFHLRILIRDGPIQLRSSYTPPALSPQLASATQICVALVARICLCGRALNGTGRVGGEFGSDWQAAEGCVCWACGSGRGRLQDGMGGGLGCECNMAQTIQALHAREKAQVTCSLRTSDGSSRRRFTIVVLIEWHVLSTTYSCTFIYKAWREFTHTTRWCWV
ncbi:hypothetical protein PMIN01_04132 [Paraphaeosphaeria minitans]|uniref:Uncharacterized protein n=1 Tax=Paraphaeosphaeria minitans TaxID=565426 RepID=A0A9P6KUJ0_9PLEO|nr:hypothetical protein PMIN01_04132 [Paraphaeosphaeria minitans]